MIVTGDGADHLRDDAEIDPELRAQERHQE